MKDIYIFLKHPEQFYIVTIYFMPYIYVCVHIYMYIYIYRERDRERKKSCLTLCNPMDCSLSGSSVHGILWARILEWIAIPFSWGSF